MVKTNKIAGNIAKIKQYRNAFLSSIIKDKQLAIQKKSEYSPNNVIDELEKLSVLHSKLDKTFKSKCFSKRVHNSASYNATIVDGRIVITEDKGYYKSKFHLSSMEYKAIWIQAKAKSNYSELTIELNEL